MPIDLPKLPFEPMSLEPFISAETVKLHHGKHHASYVAGVNRMTKSTGLANSTLDEIIQTARHLRDKTLFNFAAQAWNHDFYWKSLNAHGGNYPNGAIGARIDEHFGSFLAFSKQLHLAATSHFGSGWAWIVLEEARLKIVTTSNAVQPNDGQFPLLVIDVWEHAYYLDYWNERAAYVSAVIEQLLNWDFANQRLNEIEANLEPVSMAGVSQGIV